MSEYGSLDNIFDHAEEIQGAVGKKLREGKESAYISKILATIKRDVDMERSLESFRYVGMDKPKLLELFTKLEFTKFIK